MGREQMSGEPASLRRVDRPPMYEAILERLREYAQAADLKRGHRLPSERDLAEQLGTSRASVKQALVVLEVQGLVETRHGGGTFLLKDDLSTESVTALVARQARLPEIMEARVGLECQLAGLAAQRRTDNDLRAMENALVLMAASVEQDADGAEGDKLFHSAVATAGRNPLLNRFLDEISSEVSESRKESLRQPGRPSQSLRQLQAILEAIRRQDAARARRTMRLHLSSVGKVRLLTWQAPIDDDDLAEPE
ncbi:MAG: FCD domain-containing protein [Actinomycetota bacterium]|nr:FCD domain-containing protein [Actinomycetota bacterium]